MNWSKLDISISGLQAHYQRGDFTPAQLVDHLLQRMDEAGDNPVFIYRLSREELAPYLSALEAQAARALPLYGVPFVIKDNIDLAGVPTTAACPAFAYTPGHSAQVVELLLAAGAVPLGKTNLDQFATGLVGSRSPYGACRNALNPDYISGGSSSGSAVAVAQGWASFSLGTDTAGSGRVPAALNNIFGLKPSRGLLSTRGVVPACRSLDCVSIFALDAADASRVFDVVAVYDARDAYARANAYVNGPGFFGLGEQSVTIGLPPAEQLAFFGDQDAEVLFQRLVERLQALDFVRLKPIDLSPFLAAAQLLYQGPWVAERYLATQPLIDQQPDALLDVTRAIIAPGAHPSAADAFAAQYQLQALKRQAEQQLSQVDCIVTPTIGRAYTLAEVASSPLQPNANLGYYTNFMNLLDCSAVALPAGLSRNGVGFGATLFHRALRDKFLLSLADRLAPSLTPGESSKSEATPRRPVTDAVDLVVCGAHMSGLPLNWQLTDRGARLVEVTHTAPVYKLFRLAGGPPMRPGLIRVPQGGVAVEVEVWRMPAAELGGFLAEIPSPLGLGKVELGGGRLVTGFICEGLAVEGAEDITPYGSWRRFLNALKTP